MDMPVDGRGLIYSLDEWEIDLGRREVRSHGSGVRLGGRAFEILEVLLQARGELVGKYDLMSRVWPGAVIEENTLQVHISSLRKAFGDREILKTAASRGYRLLGSWTPETARSEPDGANGELPTDIPAAIGKTNLSRPLTNIVAREAELMELQASLGRHRLVTIVGLGGVGKTRLAAELGWRVLKDFPAGVWLVDLAPANDLNTVISATATALGIALSNAAIGIEAVAAGIGSRPRLLILDNCEHLVTAAATLVKTLLDKAPGLKVLATSQEPLRLAEQTFYLYPLGVPSEDANNIAGYGAVELFVQRARMADRQFALQSGNETDVGEICRRLDGVPLALEMAAARLHILGLSGLRAGLAERLKMLRGMPNGGARYGSLLAMLEWSHGLLEAADQTLFRRLGIFPASFTLDAVLAVSGKSDADRWEIVDGLSRLIDKSLVTIEGHEPVRYRLLETLRLFADERLREAGEFEATAELHARYMADLFGRAEIEWETTPELEWLSRYRPEIHGLRAGLDWALAAPDRHDVAMALAASGATLFLALSLIADGKRYLDHVIPLIGEHTPVASAAHVFLQAASLLVQTQDSQGLIYAERAAALYHQIGHPHDRGAALTAVGFFQAVQNRPEEATATLEEAWQLLADSNQKKRQLRVMNHLGIAASDAGDYDAARRHLTRARSLAQAIKSLFEWGIVINLSVVEGRDGDFVQAFEMAREAMPFLRESPRWRDFEMGAANLVEILLNLERTAEARPYAEEAIAQTGAADKPALLTLSCWAALSAFEGRLTEAVQLLGFLDVECERQETTHREQPLQGKIDALFEATFSAAELQTLRAEGACWSFAEAIEFTLTRLLPSP
jgi:predicted ATPase/DNA-binding winged helix-turn-helix (wHTH) protein